MPFLGSTLSKTLKIMHIRAKTVIEAISASVAKLVITKNPCIRIQIAMKIIHPWTTQVIILSQAV